MFQKSKMILLGALVILAGCQTLYQERSCQCEKMCSCGKTCACAGK